MARPTCSVCGRPLDTSGPGRPVDCCPRWVRAPRAPRPVRDGLERLVNAVDERILDPAGRVGLLARALAQPAVLMLLLVFALIVAVAVW